MIGPCPFLCGSAPGKGVARTSAIPLGQGQGGACARFSTLPAPKKNPGMPG